MKAAKESQSRPHVTETVKTDYHGNDDYSDMLLKKNFAVMPDYSLYISPYQDDEGRNDGYPIEPKEGSYALRVGDRLVVRCRLPIGPNRKIETICVDFYRGAIQINKRLPIGTIGKFACFGGKRK